jgi:hypothetical protein
MLGVFALCVIRMTPPYTEFLTVRDIVERIVVDPETPQTSNGDIRRKLHTIFHTNQIYELEASEIEILNRRGKKYIDARYEVRLPIFWRIDLVLKFDDLLYQVGDPRPLSASDLPKAR